ncbi:MAG: hypothetical protein NXI21_13290 [Alphaproteobacteria bacterium]|nr:hypothetical protein [Alphaproteobacteria bacterium]
MAEPGVTQQTAAAPADAAGLDGPAARSPLAGLLGPMGGPVTIEEHPLLAKISLRGDAADPAFLAGAEAALGLALPTEPLSFVADDAVRIHWIAYDHWMIYGAEGTEHDLLAALAGRLDALHHAAVDVSDYYTVIRVSGAKARALLQKGSPVDLHPRAFWPGKCTGTVFHHAAVFLAQTAELEDGGATYDLQIRWSFARYLWDYLVDGAREWRAA